MADVENLQIEIQAAFCNLSEEKLKDVCSKLNIILPPESKGRLVFIQALNKYLETEELDYEKLKELLSSLSMEGKVMAPTPEKDDVTVKAEQKPAVSISKFKRDFKISGRIGDLSQKDRLSFSSLVHQIENGLKNDYTEDETKKRR